MAHTANLRLFVCRTVRPIALRQRSPFQGQIAAVSSQWGVAKGRWVQPVRAEHHEAKSKRSGVTRASASGSSFRDASDALSQAQPEKGLDATPGLGTQPRILQVFLSLTCVHVRLLHLTALVRRQHPCQCSQHYIANSPSAALDSCPTMQDWHDDLAAQKLGWSALV